MLWLHTFLCAHAVGGCAAQPPPVPPVAAPPIAGELDLDALLAEARRGEPIDARTRSEIFARFKTEAGDRTLAFVVAAIASPAWEQDMLALVDVPIETVSEAAMDDVVDQVYWQLTAARVLGAIGSAAAVRPLLQMLMSPFKANAHGVALDALLKIGAPSVAAALAVLDGRDDELIAFGKRELVRAAVDQGKAHSPLAVAGNPVIAAIRVLAYVATPRAARALLDLARGGDKVRAQLAAAQLCQLPASEEMRVAFSDVYRSAAISDVIPPGNFAKDVLAESGHLMFDRAINAMIIDGALAMDGSNDAALISKALLPGAVRGATPADWPKIERLLQAVGSVPFADEVADAKQLLDACAEDAVCYRQRAGANTKAAYMALLLDGDNAKSLAAEQQDEVALRGALRFSPRGDEALAAELQRIVETQIDQRHGLIRTWQLDAFVTRLRQRMRRP